MKPKPRAQLVGSRAQLGPTLDEGARRPESLPDGVGVLVWRQGGKAKIVYAEMVTEFERLPSRTEPRTPKLKVPGAPQEGVVKMVQDPGSYGPCDKAWVVELSSVTPQGGWGPLLYDVAMECASLWGGGLTPDRFSVSPFAHAVWSFYLKRRRMVRKRQLDTLDGQLTPSKSDDCAQTSADDWGANDDVEWFETPESKRYVKKPTTLKRLAKMGKLKVLGSAKLPGIVESCARPCGVLVVRAGG